MGARGEADVVLAHSPAAEEELMAAGKGRQRRTVMHNDFVVVGPAADPAGVKGASRRAALAQDRRGAVHRSSRAATIRARTRSSCDCGRTPV